MSDYVIRPMKERDIESIIAIDSLIRGPGGPDRAGFWRGLLSLYAEDAPHDEDGAAPVAAPHLCAVAELQDAPGTGVIGFIIGDVQSWQFGLPRHGRIVTIGIHPKHRRHGVATRLADSLIASFRVMGLPFVHCLVRPDDPLGEFFGSLGFHRPGFEILEKPITG